ncbi:MAG: energy transducer TonB [Rhodospirillaceae bacterium]|nr:energy transducer TonB [Rhodospirillaceae bacterium]
MKDDEAVAIPDVKKKPAPKPKPKPVVAKKKPEPPKKSRPRPKVKPKPKNKAKPKPKDDFASVLKTVEKLKPRPVAQKVVKKKKKDETLAQIAQVLKRKPETRRPRIGENVPSSELDLVRRQIAPCWFLPAGARDAKEMVVVIRTVVNPDGRVREAKIDASGFQMANPFYRAMAESALRAVKNPECQPFKLPLEKYNEWQVMVLTFRPGEML